MPIYRFKKAFEVARGAKVFLNLQGGVTRGALPDNREAQARRPRKSEKRLEKLRQRLKDKNRQIASLKRELASANGTAADGQKTATPEDQNSGALPDFVIIGGKKCGTTFLYHLLSRHPYVAPATEKEVHYFDTRFDRGNAWYRSHFPAPAEKGERRVITGEASPFYLYHPHAARRAAATVPRARLIALLRDPVDRAYSDYHHKARRGHEPLTFEQAIEAEEDRLRGEKEKMLADEGYRGRNFRAFSYLSRGIYVDQLMAWREFFDADQMLILKSEDMFEDTPGTLERVADFLDLPAWEADLPTTPETRNEGGYSAQISPATRERLRNYFEPHNQRLYEYLGIDFGW